MVPLAANKMLSFKIWNYGSIIFYHYKNTKQFSAAFVMRLASVTRRTKGNTKKSKFLFKDSRGHVRMKHYVVTAYKTKRCRR